VALAILFLSSCSGSPPEILFVDRSLRLIENPSKSSAEESLRIFVAIRDPDGSADIESLVIAHENSELVWNLDPGTWSTVSFGGDEWYGHTRLEHPQNAPLPRGRFTVIAEDGAGGRAESEFFLTAPVPEEMPLFPALVQVDGEVTLISEAPLSLRAYSSAGELVLSRAVAPGEVPALVVDNLRTSAAEYVYLFLDQHDGTGVNLISGPFNLAPAQ